MAIEHRTVPPSEVDQIYDGDWVHFPRKDVLFQCCDCGLTHTVNSRVDKDGRILLQFVRNPKQTRRVRRHEKIRVKRNA